MKTGLYLKFFFGLIFFCLPLSVFAQGNNNEQLTITTYYPSPYGSYDQLTANQLTATTLFTNYVYKAGDVNSDGKIDALDVPLLMDLALGKTVTDIYGKKFSLTTDPARALAVGDFDQDGTVDVKDAQILTTQVYSGSVSKQACDINQDGVVDISDVMLEIRQVLQLDPLNIRADVNHDGKIDMEDLYYVYNWALGKDPNHNPIAWVMAWPDFGNSPNKTYSGYFQGTVAMRQDGQNPDPNSTLDVQGTIKADGLQLSNLQNPALITPSIQITAGNLAANNVLTSDPTGVGTWQAPGAANICAFLGPNCSLVPGSPTVSQSNNWQPTGGEAPPYNFPDHSCQTPQDCIASGWTDNCDGNVNAQYPSNGANPNPICNDVYWWGRDCGGGGKYADQACHLRGMVNTITTVTSYPMSCACSQ